MASALKHMKNGLVGVGGLTGLAVDGAVAFGSGVAIGELYHRKADKWYGKHAPKLFAAVGKAGALIAGMITGGDPSWVGTTFNSIGDAGITTAGLEVGLRHARKASGKRAILMPAGAALPAGASETALGGRPAGRGMSWEQIEEMASAR